ncbi:MAG: hypothetical protein QGH07_10365 [Alphaproteobacteria bacterium]|nr:hypothetical protein [Alphaproteobacteria bacterium]
MLSATPGLFIWGKWQYNVVSVLALHAVAIPGIIDVGQAFAGFGHPAVITVAAILINSETLQSGGIIGSLGNTLVRAEAGLLLQVGRPGTSTRAGTRGAARHRPNS